MDEPFDASHHGRGVPDDLEMTARIREALRADAATAPYADRLRVVTIGSRAVVRGEVGDVR
jgi:predicted ATPase